MTKFYKTKEFRKLQKQWYRKLTDTGFVDIEDGQEDAEFLAGAGHVKSEPLWSAKEMLGAGPAVEVHDALDSVAADFHSGHKASYYRTATHVAAREALSGCPKKYFIFAYLCQGIGDRTIIKDAEELNGWHFTRYYVRKVANEFRDRVLSQLDEDL